jgi:hypothetical protein
MRVRLGLVAVWVAANLAMSGTAWALSVEWQWRQNTGAATPPAGHAQETSINPVPGKEVRVSVGNATGCEIVKIELWEEDAFFDPDDFGGSPPFTPTGPGQAESGWMRPPMQTDDPGSESEWYAEVTAICNGKEEVTRTGVLHVPHGVVTGSSMQEKMNVDVNGQASVKGQAGANVGVASGEVSVQGTGTGQYQRNEVTGLDLKAGMIDPVTRIQVFTYGDFPADWEIGIEPNAVIMQPSQVRPLLLTYVAPAAGSAIYSLRTDTKRTNSMTDPAMLLVEKTFHPKSVFRIAYRKHLYKFLYYSDNTAAIAAVRFLDTEPSIEIDVTAPQAGTIGLLVPFSFVDVASGSLEVSLDGQTIAATEIDQSAVSRTLEVPVPAGSHTLKLRGSVASDVTRIPKCIRMGQPDRC